jgi:putative transposase
MPGYKAAAELAGSGALDGLFAQIDAGEMDLTGDGRWGACQRSCARA